MRKLLVCLILLMTSIVSKAEQWYYLESNSNPESSSGMVYIILKDNSGYYWLHSESLFRVKTNLIKSRDYYLDEFNNSSPSDGSVIKGVNRSFSLGSSYTKRGCFYQLTLEQTTEKSYVFKYANRFEVAISKDFNTLISDLESVNPQYFFCQSLENFITRKSIDDLF